MQAHLLVLLLEVEETLPLTAHWLSKDACLNINLFAITCFQKKNNASMASSFVRKTALLVLLTHAQTS